MPVVAVKGIQKHRWYITTFSTMFYVTTVFCYVMPVTLLLSFSKKPAPGGDLIRVDLIRVDLSRFLGTNRYTEVY